MDIKSIIKNKRLSLGLTLEEVGSAVGVTKATVQRWESGNISNLRRDKIAKLAAVLKLDPMELVGVESSNNYIPVTAMLPIYGCIPAGLPALAEEYIEGYMPTSVPNPDEYFYLRVNGDSMIGAGIVDGCKVLIHKQSSADDGQIVACRVNGDEATLKRFKHHGSVVLLKPENNAYDDRIIPVEDFENGNAQIIGVVKQIVIDM